MKEILFIIISFIYNYLFAQSVTHNYTYFINYKQQHYEVINTQNCFNMYSVFIHKGTVWKHFSGAEYSIIFQKKWRHQIQNQPYNHWEGICNQIISSLWLSKDYVYYHFRVSPSRISTKDSVSFFTPRSPLHGSFKPLFIYNKADSILGVPIVYYLESQEKIVDSIRVSYFGATPYLNNKNYKVYLYQLEGFYWLSETKKEYRKMVKLYFALKLGLWDMMLIMSRVGVFEKVGLSK